jgi:cell division septum initiation protein DivIVA
MAVFEDTQKMADQAEAAAEALNGRFIGPRLGKHAPPPLPFYPPMCPWSGLLHYRGKQVSYEEYMQSYQESLASDIEHRRRAQDNYEERLHRDTAVNLGGLVQEHLEENERHENEVEEIEERRERRRKLEERDAAAARGVSMQDYDDDTEDKQEHDDDTGDMDR